MAAPQFLTTADARWAYRQIVRFGGLPRADTGVTMPFVDLNDADSWFAQDIQIDGRHISNKASQLNWRGKGVWTAQDFFGRKIVIPCMFDEGNTVGQSYPAAKGVLSQAGEQYLTFDNLTAMRVRLNSFSEAKMLTPHAPYLWDAPLEFLSRNPFAEDIGGRTSVGPIDLSSGTATVNVNYLGHAYGEPVVHIHTPGGMGVLGSITVNNSTYSGQSVNAFSGWGGAGSHDFYVDSELFTAVIDVSQFPPTGTFPFLYPGNNAIVITVGASGMSGATATITFSAKYEF